MGSRRYISRSSTSFESLQLSDSSPPQQPPGHGVDEAQESGKAHGEATSPSEADFGTLPRFVRWLGVAR